MLADPVIDGLPSREWTTTVTVDSDGRVTDVAGHVGVPRRLPAVPLRSADEVLTSSGGQITGPGSASEEPGTRTRHVTIRSVRLVLAFEPCPRKGARLAPTWEFIARDDMGERSWASRRESAAEPENDC
ncbi:hypothetical protein [Streptomyces sp. NPDC001450]